MTCPAGQPDRPGCVRCPDGARQHLTAVTVYDIACLYSGSAAAAGRDPKLSPADRTRLEARYAVRAMHYLRAR